MSTLIITPKSSAQETGLITFLDDLRIDYKTNEDIDDTTYLLSSPVNVKHLKKSMAQAKNGELTEITIDDICTQ